MPPVRSSRAQANPNEDVFQLNWAPSEPQTPQTISFAPAMTPVSFTEPPPSIDDVPTESTLFPSAFENDLPSSRKQTHGKKRPVDHIPRPPNAFILFRSSFIKSQHVSANVEGNHGTLSKIVGMVWHNLPYEERQVWQAKAKRALADHKKRFPEYSFRPKDKDAARANTTISSPAKRKQREVGPRDVKRCEVIADLVRSGKKGKELEEAIDEFDRQRVVEVQTRFEAPITARQYRRSSSAPAPETELSKSQAAFIPLLSTPPTPSRRKRSSSTSRSHLPAIKTDSPTLSRQTTLIVDESLQNDDAAFSEANFSSFSTEYSLDSPTETVFAEQYESDSAMDFNSFSFSSHCTTPNTESYSPFENPTTPVVDANDLSSLFYSSSHTQYTHHVDDLLSPISPMHTQPQTPATPYWEPFSMYASSHHYDDANTLGHAYTQNSASVAAQDASELVFADMPPLVDPPVSLDMTNEVNFDIAAHYGVPTAEATICAPIPQMSKQPVFDFGDSHFNYMNSAADYRSPMDHLNYPELSMNCLPITGF